ncbi:MAG: hypothetical protein ABI622_01100 [Chloroflexota bacterium]
MSGGDLHARFGVWLADGALGAPPRDAAVHASACPECLGGIAAIDALAAIDLGTASLPASRGGATIARQRPGLRAAIAAAVVAIAALGTGVVGGPLLTGSRAPATPQQQVLAGTGTPEETATPTADPSTRSTASPTAALMPSQRPTLAPYVPPAPTFATPRPTVRATPEPTPTLAPSPTPRPSPDDCANGIDDDGDLLIDAADPGCVLDGNEASADPPPPLDDCENGLDDDGDLLIDAADPGCVLDGNEASA